MQKKVILTDIDGVTTKWQSGLPHFLAKHNIPTDSCLDMFYTEQFKSPKDIFGCDEELANKLLIEYNNSPFIRYLSPYDDALHVINSLKNEYDFVAITALGNATTVSLNRIANLNSLFPSAFKEVLVVDAHESKTKQFKYALEKYGDRIVCYIDDLTKNLVDSEFMLSEIPDFKNIHMIRVTGNRDINPNNVTVRDWYDIAHLLGNPVK
ncbi:HAD-superfamily hydrolase [Morganella phage vB_Mm5]